MCAQVVCEVPAECMVNANPCETPLECGDCYQNNICQSPTEFNPCTAAAVGGEQNVNCGCVDYSGCCYQQPSRALPIRPQTNICRATEPLETETIYKRSYPGNYGEAFKAKPIKPCNNISSIKEPMEKCTIQKLSYLPHNCVARVSPIKPKDNCLNFRGPLYAMTSQKHDFMPKGYCRRQPIRPTTGIWKSNDPLERCTVNRLSYMPVDVCKNPPPKPIVQGYSYIRPTAPGEQCTIQKLSYLPVCLPAKEPMPWAEKSRCPPPKYENLCTTYNLSYIPNCNAQRLAPIMPMNGLKFLGTDCNDGNTVYKLSYIANDARCCRPPPVLPVNGLELPKGSMEKCTVQKLSYQPNYCVGRTAAIRPRENCIKPSGAMYFMTTQKHDFVPKPMSRRNPIKPASLICRATGGFEKCTVNRLSYMPVNVCEYRRPAAVVPPTGICRPEGSMEKCTTYKLSYIPNCIGPREPLPWARASSYVKPTSPIEKCTVQKLSYGPPGTFSRCGACCNQNNTPSNFPKAGIC
ncbi:uncharacterized protein ACRADG_000092 [Cochliomyia hominivorax]